MKIDLGSIIKNTAMFVEKTTGAVLNGEKKKQIAVVVIKAIADAKKYDVSEKEISDQIDDVVDSYNRVSAIFKRNKAANAARKIQ